MRLGANLERRLVECLWFMGVLLLTDYSIRFQHMGLLALLSGDLADFLRSIFDLDRWTWLLLLPTRLQNQAFNGGNDQQLSYDRRHFSSRTAWIGNPCNHFSSLSYICYM